MASAGASRRSLRPGITTVAPGLTSTTAAVAAVGARGAGVVDPNPSVATSLAAAAAAVPSVDLDLTGDTATVLDRLDQQVTATLQVIDGNLFKAAEVASDMMGDVRAVCGNLAASHAAIKDWVTFFSHFGIPDEASFASALQAGSGNVVGAAGGAASAKKGSKKKTGRTPRKPTSARRTRRGSVDSAATGGADTDGEMANVEDASWLSRRTSGEFEIGAPSPAPTRRSARKRPAAEAQDSSASIQMSPPIATPFYKPTTTPGKFLAASPAFDQSGQSDSPSNMLSSPLRTATMMHASPSILQLASAMKRRRGTTPADTTSTMFAHDTSAISSIYEASPSITLGTATMVYRTPGGVTSDAGTPASDASVTLSSPLRATSMAPPPDRLPADDATPAHKGVPAGAFHPATPISNSLVDPSTSFGADPSVLVDLDESDDDDDNEDGGGRGGFDLSLFPPVFRSGEAAALITQVYSQFHSTRSDALSMAQLLDLVPNLGTAKAALFLETLVSRKLLRPFVVGSTMYWKRR